MLADAPQKPPGTALLWAEFIALHRKRGSNGFGPSPISESDIFYRQRNRGWKFASWEIQAIEAADRAYLEVADKKRSERK